MKSSTPNTSVAGTPQTVPVPDENLWPMRIGWVAVILLLGTIISAAIIFSLPDTRSQEAGTNSLPEALTVSLEEGTRLVEEGQLDSAEALYSRLISDFPQHPQGYNNLAALYALRGDLEQSRGLLEQAMATNAEYRAIYRNLGTIYAELARDSYGRALQLEPIELRTQLQILDDRGTAQLVAATEQQTPTVRELVEQSEKTPLLAAIEEQPPTAPVAESIPSGPEPTVPVEPIATVVADEPAAVNTAVSEAEITTAAELTPAVETSAVPAAVTEEAPAVIESTDPLVVAALQPETPEQFMQRWAAAWSAQKADDYFSFYAEDYNPRSHNTRADWMKKRRSRIVRPAFIEISLSSFEIISSSEKLAEIELIQHYRNDRFQDKTRKRFELARLDDSWVITRERSLGGVK